VITDCDNELSIEQSIIVLLCLLKYSMLSVSLFILMVFIKSMSLSVLIRNCDLIFGSFGLNFSLLLSKLDSAMFLSLLLKLGDSLNDSYT